VQTIELLKTFSEPHRLRILNLLLTSELSVSELVEILTLSQSNVSHHLKILKNQGLIESYKSGAQKYYRNIEQPSIPSNLQKIWSELKTIIKELPESSEDERKLINAIAQRKNSDLDNTINLWRKQQPDILFTSEVALDGIPKTHNLAVDIGSGMGDFFKVIERSFRKIICIEISQNQLKIARENIMNQEQVHLLQSDAHFLPLGDHVADSIYFRMALRFFKNPEMAIQEAIRILNISGKISIIDQIDSLNSFSEQFFKKLCLENSNLYLVKYNRRGGLFLCTLEKKYPDQEKF